MLPLQTHCCLTRLPAARLAPQQSLSLQESAPLAPESVVCPILVTVAVLVQFRGVEVCLPFHEGDQHDVSTASQHLVSHMAVVQCVQ